MQSSPFNKYLPGAPISTVNPSCDRAALNPASHAPSLFALY